MRFFTCTIGGTAAIVIIFFFCGLTVHCPLSRIWSQAERSRRAIYAFGHESFNSFLYAAILFADLGDLNTTTVLAYFPRSDPCPSGGQCPNIETDTMHIILCIFLFAAKDAAEICARKETHSDPAPQIEVDAHLFGTT